MITQATPADLSYIVALSKRHAEEVGFLTSAAMLGYIERDRVRINRQNGDPIGYFLTSAVRPDLRIFQACVQLDARGLRHGQALLADLLSTAAPRGTRRLTLHCRDGLDSNQFWNACGFHPTRLLPGGSARRKIIIEWTLEIPQALANPALPYAAALLRSLSTGPQSGPGPTAGFQIPRPRQASPTPAHPHLAAI